MPVKDLLARQIQSYEIGRIRTGIYDGRPVTIDTLRFTSASAPAIDAVAAMFGGTPRPWDNRGHHEFEVITEATEAMVTLPPYGEVVSMWYEKWNKGGCERRCDSEQMKSGGPCLCAPLLEQFAPEDRGRERARLAQQGKACFLQTRVSMILPDLPDVGVWRLDTKSYYGTVGLLAKLRIMAMAREQGIFLPARLWIDHQVNVSEGKTKHYPVPQWSLLNTTREIASGRLAETGMAAQLPPPPGEQPRAITSGTDNGNAKANGRPAKAKRQQPRQGPREAQDIANDAANATTREDIETLSAEMKDARWEHDYIYPDLNPDGVHDELQAYLRARWKALPAGGGDGS